jgi:hypothetical protein
VESRLKQGSIKVRIDAPARNPYNRLVLNLRHPGRARMRHVLVNGKEYRDCDFENGIVRLAAGARTYTVEARY